MPLSLWPLLSDAKAELARLDGIGKTLPNPELLLQPLNTREAIRSSSLEGTYTTAEELLLFDPEDGGTASGQRVSDWVEVWNHAQALQHGVELLNDLPLSLRVIREMHRVLLTGVRGRDRAPGEFRRIQVHVGNNKRFVPPPVPELDACLNDLEHFLNEADAIEPLVRAFLAHYQFEAIHPFIDGNGRVGRALLSLCAFKWCGLSHPWLYMSPFFDRHRDEYIERLFAVSTDGAWDAWLDFCLHGVIEVCEDAIARCDRLQTLRQQYHSAADRYGGRTHRIIEILFARPIIKISRVAAQLGVTYPTAKTDIQRLIGMDILRESPKSYPKAFVAHEIFEAAYGED